jgi:hypothetical protein
VEHILIELQQKNDKHKQSIEHEESKHRLVPQLYEVRRDPSLQTNVSTHKNC